jgi:choline dehydrogenase
MVTLPEATNSSEAIIAEALARDPASSLPADVDPTVLAGYKAQRKIVIGQYSNPNVGVGVLNWNTDTVAQVYHQKPLSRGSITINTTDPLSPPKFDYRTCTDPTDFQINIALVNKTREWMSAPEIAALGPTEASPLGENVQSNEDILAAIRESIGPTNAHQCCTAPMLPLSLGGVVGPDRKVYGVTGLRVGDVSCFPITLSGAPTATVYASAEKVSYLIAFQRECIVDVLTLSSLQILLKKSMVLNRWKWLAKLAASARLVSIQNSFRWKISHILCKSVYISHIPQLFLNYFLYTIIIIYEIYMNFLIVYIT